MIKFKLLNANQEAVVEKITAQHLKSVIDVITTAPPCPTNDDDVEFELSSDDAEELMKEIAVVASKLESGTIAGRLWVSYDSIEETLHNSKD
jgi:predicted small metal-binding protein